MTDRLRVATIGAGCFSRFHYDAWSRLGVDLVALYEQDRKAARWIADEYVIPSVHHTIEAMLEAERPELLDIITPPPTHLNFIQILAENKVAIICQKPFTENLEQALRAVDTGERAQTLIVVHENFRFQPWYGQIKKILEQGVLGEPYGQDEESPVAYEWQDRGFGGDSLYRFQRHVV